MADGDELLDTIKTAIEAIRNLADEGSLDLLVWEASHVDWPNVEGPARVYATGQAQNLLDAVALADGIRRSLQAGIHRTVPVLDADRSGDRTTVAQSS
jgi:hypothetical protein